jgi:aminoglycoside phosphotransferase (APT) family kinase protein
MLGSGEVVLRAAKHAVEQGHEVLLCNRRDGPPAGKVPRYIEKGVEIAHIQEAQVTSGGGLAAGSTAHSLSSWLSPRLGAAGDIRIEGLEAPDSNGFSNITMLFDAIWRDEDRTEHRRTFVARVETTGEGLFPSYDIDRQFRTIKGLEGTAVSVPRALWMERDPGILGAPFLIMEFIGGHVPSDDPSFAASGWVLGLSPSQRGTLCDNALAALVEVHAVDWRGRGLDWLKRPGGGTSAERELTYYEEFYRWAAEGHGVPVIEAGLAWARERTPATEDLVLSWGDSRIGNMIFGDDIGVRAVIDWEGASIAAREKDLGHWLQLTHVYTVQFGLDLPDGFPDREALLRRYEELSGVHLGDVHFYEVMSGIHSAIQAMRALTLMGRASGGVDEAVLRNNPFTRGLARLIGIEMSAEGGLAVLTGKR